MKRLNAKEAAAYLEISRTKFYEYLNAGRIPFIQHLKSDRKTFLISDLDRFLLSGRRLTEHKTELTIHTLQNKNDFPKDKEFLRVFNTLEAQ